MNVIKNFLPENTDRKIYAVMSLDYFKQVSLDEYIKPVNYSVDDYTAKILLDKVELTADKKVNFTFKCAAKTNEQKSVHLLLGNGRKKVATNRQFTALAA